MIRSLPGQLRAVHVPSHACWTWPGSAPKPPGTFSGTLLNLTWLCTKASWNLLRNLFRKPVELDLAVHQSLPDLLRNLFRNLLRNLALHQSLPDLLRNLLRNPVEPDLALHQGFLLPGTFSRTFSGTLLNLTWLCAKASQTFSGTFRDLLRNPVERDLALHQSLPDLLRNLPEPSPEPRWTWPGACTSAHRSYSGLKTLLAYAVGEKKKNAIQCHHSSWYHQVILISTRYFPMKPP